MLNKAKPTAAAASRSHPPKARSPGPLPIAAGLIAVVLLVVYYTSGRPVGMTTSQVRREEGGSRAGTARCSGGGSGSHQRRNRSATRPGVATAGLATTPTH